jgi:hypothetical protein
MRALRRPPFDAISGSPAIAKAYSQVKPAAKEFD